MLSPTEEAELRRQDRWSRLLAYPTYALITAGLKCLGYRFKDVDKFRAELWKKLDAHPGPVLWAANHLTMIDSFLVYWAVFPWSRAADSKRLPWSTPEYSNYYNLGGPLLSKALRALLYLCRCLPFVRAGEDEASARWRARVFEKCGVILKRGDSVFIYPEAGRARSGWLEPRRPKDFLGKLALEAPGSKFLCVYLRGERQVLATVLPERGESFRMHAELIEGSLPGETTARAVSERLFKTLGELQERWFKDSPMEKNCGGNDVVDLKAPLLREHFDDDGDVDPEWAGLHLTTKERQYLGAVPPDRIFGTFWKLFAAKEAAHKALTRARVYTPRGAFKMLEVDLFRRTVTHLPTGGRLDIAFTHDDADAIHCVAVLRGGYIGDDHAPGDVLWGVEEVPKGDSPGEFVRRRCLEFIAESSDDIPSAAVLTLSESEGIPTVLRAGKPCPWSVSLSHSGRFAAYSLMIS